MREPGYLIDSGPADRDAIHVAIAAVEAGETLQPGQHAHMVNGKAMAGEPSSALLHNVPGTSHLGVGVVDPFLVIPVQPGQRFWLFLYPGTVTSLRHEWSHPAFPRHTRVITEEERAVARKWLADFADRWEIDVDRLVKDAVAGDYVVFGTDYHQNVAPDPKFWEMLEIVTGASFNQAHRDGTTFGCSC